MPTSDVNLTSLVCHGRFIRLSISFESRLGIYLIAIGLMIACTPPVMRGGTEREQEFPGLVLDHLFGIHVLKNVNAVEGKRIWWTS